MKIKITILALLPVLVLAQEPNSPVHGLNELPTLHGTQDALRGYITKENEAKRGLPFSLTVEDKPPYSVSVTLSVTKTNDLASLSDVYVYEDPIRHSLWVRLAPSAQTTSNAVFQCNLPYDLAKRSFIVLACGKRNRRDASFSDRIQAGNNRTEAWRILKLEYKKKYEIRLGSYVPETLFVPPDPKTVAPGEEEKIDIRIEM